MTKFLGVEFAPLLIPTHRRLETLAVVHYVIVFLLLPVICVVVPFYIFMWTSYWWIMLFYLAWFCYDYETPSRGGRRAGWFRNSPVWPYFRDYFPIRLIKTADLDPNRNYIMGYHPHGVISVGAFCNFATEATNFSKMFPGVTAHPCTLKGQFWFPFRREYIMGCGKLHKTYCLLLASATFPLLKLHIIIVAISETVILLSFYVTLLHWKEVKVYFLKYKLI